MYIQHQFDGEAVVSKKEESKSNTLQKSLGSRASDTREHQKWQSLRINKKKCDTFGQMEYWQVVSHCTIL